MNRTNKTGAGKLRYDLIPHVAEREVVRALMHGAETHGERDWEKGMPWSLLYAAAKRHESDWWIGETRDRESRVHALAHAAASLMMLIEYELSGTFEEFDDRPYSYVQDGSTEIFENKGIPFTNSPGEETPGS